MDTAERALPEIDVPPYKGDRYQADTPDTLDLAERADLAINAITRMLDPRRDYLMYTSALLDRTPPVIECSDSDGAVSCAPKHLESLPLLRIMSGSTFNLDVDSHLPYQGKVVLTVKNADRVAFRVPEWTRREGVACDLNGRPRAVDWSGGNVGEMDETLAKLQQAFSP